MRFFIARVSHRGGLGKVFMGLVDRVAVPAVFLSLLFTLSVASQDPRPVLTNETDVNLVIRKFFQEFAAEDLEGVKGMWSIESADSIQHLKEIEKAFEEHDQIKFEDVTYSTLARGGETAVIRVRFQQTAIKSKTNQHGNIFDTHNLIFELTRQNDTWKIVRYTSAESYLADALNNVKGEAERSTFIDTHKDLDSRVFIRHLLTRGQQALKGDQNAPLSIELLELALTVANRWGDSSQLKSILPNLSQAYSASGDFDNSLNVLQRALELSREVKDPDFESKVWLSMGIAYANKGDYRKLIEATNKRLSHAEAVGDKVEMLRALINLGAGYSWLGDYYKVFECQNRAQRLMEDIGKNDPKILTSPMAAALLQSMGLLYKRMGDTEMALEYYFKSLKISEENGDLHSRAGTIINMAELYLTAGDHARAIDEFKKAFERFEIQTNQGGMAVAANGIGKAYWDLGDYKAATEYYRKALKIREDPRTNAGRDSDRLKVAYGQFKTGDSLNALTTAETIANRPKRDVLDLGSVSANLLAGKIHRANGDLDKSGRYFAEAINISEGERKSYVGNSTAEGLIDNTKASPFYEMVKLRVDQNRSAEAFAFAESAKARALVDILIRGKIDFSKSMKPEERLAEKKLRDDIVSASAQLSFENRRSKPDAIRVSKLQNALKRKRLELDAFQLRLYSERPELKIERGEMLPITLEKAALLLPNSRSALVEFVVADDKTIVFVVTRDAAKKVLLKTFLVDMTDKELGKLVESYRLALAGGDLVFQTRSNHLYNLLLKPAGEELADKTNLIIVPDGPLWDLPFQALRDEQNKYLVERAAISYAPSLTALQEMSRKATTKTPNGDALLLAFGNPMVDKGTLDRVKQVSMSENLDPLPESERLVNELGKMYGANRSKVFLSNSAQEGMVKSEAPKYRIVQFATHGILNNHSPLYSHLLLAKNDTSPHEDGLLEAWEMKDLDLNADLVILSACDTARGKVSGEGVIGMTWALFIAGTPSTVASQWQVESTSTTEYMLEFHRQLLKGKTTKAEALRRASLKLLKSGKFSHPSYWAGWVLVGDGS